MISPHAITGCIDRMRRFYPGSRILLLVLLMLGAASVAHAQAVRYVDHAATGANDGASWADAFTTLQDALSASARGSGDEIWVAAGTYRPDQGQAVTEGDRSASFQLKSNVALYGGFNATEATRAERHWQANVTILSGDLLGNDNENVDLEEPTRQDNSYNVVIATDVDPWTVLDGFTVTGGNAVNQDEPSGRGLLGGGLVLDHLAHRFETTRPRFAHLIFEANAAGFRGGGVYLRIRGFDFEYVTFRNNVAPEGGGLYHDGSIATLRHAVFIGNRAGVGGAMTVESGEMRLRQVTLQDNIAESWAGGLQLDAARLMLLNGVFAGNHALRFEGGAMVANEAVATLVNVVFTGNTAGQDGGAYVNGASHVSLTNVTFSGNRAGRRGGALYSDGGFEGFEDIDLAATVDNTIFWGNTAAEHGPEIYNARGHRPTHLLLRHSLLAGGLAEGMDDEGGNVFSDPLFVDPDGPDDVPGTLDDDLRLQRGSSAIDAGANDALPADSLDFDGDGDVLEPLPIDLDSHQRIFDGGSGMTVVDLGAYEFDAPVVDTAVEHPVLDRLPGMRLEVYPNPFRDRAFVRLDTGALRDVQQVTVRLFDSLGRLLQTIYQGRVHPGQPLHFAVEAAQWPSGLYFLRVSSSTHATTKGILLQR